MGKFLEHRVCSIEPRCVWCCENVASLWLGPRTKLYVPLLLETANKIQRRKAL